MIDLTARFQHGRYNNDTADKKAVGKYYRPGIGKRVYFIHSYVPIVPMYLLKNGGIMSRSLHACIFLFSFASSAGEKRICTLGKINQIHFFAGIVICTFISLAAIKYLRSRQVHNRCIMLTHLKLW